MKKTVLLFAVIFFQLFGSSQEIGFNTTDIGGEFQVYPAGTITGLHIAFNAKLHSSFLFRIGYNKTDRKDWGEHADEKGNGWGGSVGYRYYFKPFPYKFFIGARTDLWRMSIDWKQGLVSGNSKTWTIQPVFETGYTFLVNDQVFITPFLANGVEINMITDGQDVGHGFISLLGISLGVRF